MAVLPQERKLCLWGEPPTYSGRGKPRVHGDKFQINDTCTWSEPSQTIEQEDAKLARGRIRVWTRKHFRLSPDHPMSIILVERLPEDGSLRVNKPMSVDRKVLRSLCDRYLYSYCCLKNCNF
ncbi:hypothetical protein [Nostoc sp. ChiQUE01b]|uniref:hypothetical protein n=1 Tax=Nostoc sp. ChiQUE01b TaxID=3075376 RepID=UPI002AD32318|nr:hypothetical protein [Nostoc sp. ChiQUE01b]MDZ8264688.1 hypothetical protein [Nostoc sp. ChiQUE01b]